MSVLTVNTATKLYNDSAALIRVSFNIEQPATVVLTGNNGSGKSTLLRCIAGIERLDEGEIQKSATVSLVGEQSYLYGELTLLENLELAALTVSQAEERIGSLTDRFGLSPQLGKRARYCSRGTAQKAAIVRALLRAPEILLLDEPFSNLDAAGHETLLALISEHRARGGTVIAALHEKELVNSLADRVLQLDGGRLVAG